MSRELLLMAGSRKYSIIGLSTLRPGTAGVASVSNKKCSLVSLMVELNESACVLFNSILL
jgi:hypothetical protein